MKWRPGHGADWPGALPDEVGEATGRTFPRASWKAIFMLRPTVRNGIDPDYDSAGFLVRSLLIVLAR